MGRRKVKELRREIRHLRWWVCVLAVSLLITYTWSQMQLDAMDLRIRGIFPDPTEEEPVPLSPADSILIIPLTQQDSPAHY